MNFRCISLSFAMASIATAEPAGYDPLKVPDVKIESTTFEINDAKRNRELPVRVYLPVSTKPAPVVIFSHGLGGSRDGNPYLGNHWAERGYVVVFVQHPGSDDSVWKTAAPGQRMVDLKKAASLENFMLRGEDIPVVIDTLTEWNASKDHALYDRLDLKHIGMSGHSFGATTTQAIAGQSLVGGRLSSRDPRVSAAVMMSPSLPALGDPAKAFQSITIPCLLMTGTLDDSPISSTTPEDRQKVFPNLTHAPAWQVIFDQATHMSFNDRDLQGNSESGKRYHALILTFTTAFWDAQLKGDAAAKTWLNGDGPRSILKPEDKWEMNGLAKDKP